MTRVRIPVNDLRRAIAADREIIEQAMSDVLDSGWLVHGEQHSAFEAEFAEFVGTSHCVGIGNGTEALAIALRALEIGVGAEVCIVGNAGFYAATACLEVGATPLYVDVLPETLNIDPASLSHGLERQPAAVIATHLYGGLCEIELIARMCAAASVPLIEDCAQATGAGRTGGSRAGSFGTIGCFSFYPTKNLGAIGDGGAITTSSEEIAANCRGIRQYGWSERYVVERPGLNSRLDELQAAVLRYRLRTLDARNARRRGIAARYARALATSDTARLVFWDDDSHVGHLAVVKTSARDALRAFLAARDIASDIHYPVPDLAQPVWTTVDVSPIDIGSLHTAEACAQVLSVPCFPEMDEQDITRVESALLEYATSSTSDGGAH